MNHTTEHNASEIRPALFDAGVQVALLRRLWPRVLGQIDRDPDSPTHGSCDRHHWLYRLQDFESGVLHQAAWPLAVCAELIEEGVAFGFSAAYARTLATAIMQRTTIALKRHGGLLDEYYPGERSLPGTVFSAYATLKSALLLRQDAILHAPGLERTATLLLRHRPTPAANQDVAAAAFLGLYATHRRWHQAEVADTIALLLQRSADQGRFDEYGGGDLGYASVTLHYLACMVADASHPCETQLDHLASFLADFVSPSGMLGGEYAARSTTYFLPYGFLLAAYRQPRLAKIFGRLDISSSFNRLDDRYLLHYSLGSLVDTLRHLRRSPWVNETRTTAESGWRIHDHRASGLLAMVRGESALYLGLRKGLTWQLEHAGVTTIDCGYRIQRRNQTYATCVIDPACHPEITMTPEQVTVSVISRFLAYRNLVMSPWKVVLLRLLGFLGPWLNGYFKKRLIKQARPLAGPRLRRRLTLTLQDALLTVEDDIQGLAPDDRCVVAPPVSPRLVPSARFHQPGEADALLRRQTLSNTTRTRQLPLASQEQASPLLDRPNLGEG
ncbi:MAG: hypothetical protein HQL66_06720 [Magnetococcales bacterium]|nr:hypothetical protein [Magnetococcales bacterium]